MLQILQKATIDEQLKPVKQNLSLNTKNNPTRLKGK